eukprot:5782673-Pyramimonas_sp.AAC.1
MASVALLIRCSASSCRCPLDECVASSCSGRITWRVETAGAGSKSDSCRPAIELSDCAPALQECAREPIEDMQVRRAWLVAATLSFDLGRVPVSYTHLTLPTILLV